MRRREFLGTLAAAAAPAARPNIVFIYTDDQRWDAMSCAGHPFLKTPNLDRIAREGARFGNAFVTTPLCSPSRASFLTGRYVHAHGVTGNGDNNALSHQLVTWPRLSHDGGYETAYVGKWHMGNDDTPRPGFDRWVSFRGQGAYVDPALNIDGKAERVAGYMTDLLTEHAVAFIRRPHSKPFALYLGHKAAHGPFTPAARHKDLFAGQAIRRAPSAGDTLEGKPALQQPATGNPLRGPNDETILNQIRTLAAVDEGVGRVLEALEAARQLDNTVVVFSSDNGYFWGEHGLGDKRAAYEESIRIPLLVRYPRLVRAGTLIEQAALNVDIAPTMLELAGLRIPAEVHGRSLVPLLRGQARNWRRSFLAEYFAEQQYPRIPSWQAVRTEKWKYIHYTELAGADELYDLAGDAYEMKNLIGETGAKKVLDSLKADLQRLLAATR
ncbi:MAG: sulfatase [Acidobacteriota bacterium]